MVLVTKHVWKTDCFREKLLRTRDKQTERSFRMHAKRALLWLTPVYEYVYVDDFRWKSRFRPSIIFASEHDED